MTRKEQWMKEYRKSIRPVKADLKFDERDKLDEILKTKELTFIQWLRDHIENEYNNLNKD